MFRACECRKATRSGPQEKKENKGPWGPTSSSLAAFTCPTHGPIPPPTHRRPLPGPLRVGWPLQGPWLTPRAPQRPRRGHGRPSAHYQCPAQTTAGRPPERTMATPNANQAPQGSPDMPPGSGKATRALQGRWGWQKLRRASFFVLGFQLGVPWVFSRTTATKKKSDIAS